MPAEHRVGIAQVAISEDPGSVLCASNLGSCVGVSVFDPKSGRGGMVHCLLPLSKSDPEKARNNPFTYVDTGVAQLLKMLLEAGSNKADLIICACGGATLNDPNNVFEIGKKNVTVLRKILWKNSLLLKGEHFGEDCSRTLSLHVGSGDVLLKVRGETIKMTQ